MFFKYSIFGILEPLLLKLDFTQLSMKFVKSYSNLSNYNHPFHIVCLLRMVNQYKWWVIIDDSIIHQELDTIYNTINRFSVVILLYTTNNFEITKKKSQIYIAILFVWDFFFLPIYYLCRGKHKLIETNVSPTTFLVNKLSDVYFTIIILTLVFCFIYKTKLKILNGYKIVL